MCSSWTVLSLSSKVKYLASFCSNGVLVEGADWAANWTTWSLLHSEQITVQPDKIKRYIKDKCSYPNQIPSNTVQVFNWQQKNKSKTSTYAFQGNTHYRTECSTYSSLQIYFKDVNALKINTIIDLCPMQEQLCVTPRWSAGLKANKLKAAEQMSQNLRICLSKHVLKLCSMHHRGGWTVHQPIH